MKLFRRKRRFITILVLLLFFFGVKAYYDTNTLEVRHYQIKHSKLGWVLNGLKVALLSDLHIRTIGLMEEKILEVLKNEKPDLIFVTGDMVSFKGPYEPVLSFFQKISAPYGIYGVLGNTEYSNENGSCILCHEKNSKALKESPHPIFLRNSSSPLNINGRTLHILGSDDPVEKRSQLNETLKGIPSQTPSILLAHSPELFEEASHFDIDLMLSGHTHGGQIFLAKYLRKVLPLDASLEFLEGFFQRGKMLMYVSRGVGTSYLPFRFGVKPEITFFTFSTHPINPSNSINPINSSNPSTAAPQHGSTAAPQHGSTAAPNNPINSIRITNSPPMNFFTGLTLSNLKETFNFFRIFESLGIKETPKPINTLSKPINPSNPSNPLNPLTLYDFETEDELNQLNWECHKWFERSKENATSGEYSLKVYLPPGQYPGILFRGIRTDWSKFRYLKMDVFNPSEEEYNFHIRIDDQQSGWEYANRFDADFLLKPGLNHISIPTSLMKTNLGHRSLDLKQVKGMMVFLINSPKPRQFFLDHIRLE